MRYLRLGAGETSQVSATSGLVRMCRPRHIGSEVAAYGHTVYPVDAQAIRQSTISASMQRP